MIRLKLPQNLSLLLLSISCCIEIVQAQTPTEEYEKYMFMVEAKQKAEAEYLQTVETALKTMTVTDDQIALQELEELLANKATDNNAKNNVSGLVENITDETTESVEQNDTKSVVSINPTVEELVKQNEELLNKVKSMQNAKQYIYESYSSEVVSDRSEALLVSDNVDTNYYGSKLVLTKESRDILERLVEGEAGAEGYVGAALVAQTLHDTMLEVNCFDTMTIKQWYKYSGRIDREPCDDVKRAVAFIFDNGGMAVQHKLKYFYAPDLVSSKFHESQEFVIEHGGHRFFDER